MALQLGDIAPDFDAETTEGPIRFHDWAGSSWVVLFSHPKNFTPVCTTELGYTAKLRPAFERRNVKAIGCFRRSARQACGLGQGHRGDAGRSSELSAHRRYGSFGLHPLRHDPSERFRHVDGAVGVRDRTRQEDQVDAHLPRIDGAQLRRSVARHRFSSVTDASTRWRPR